MTIELTDLDADLFKQFQQHYSTVMVLKQAGVFDSKNGSITLHYDDSGAIRKIERDAVIYIKQVFI